MASEDCNTPEYLISQSTHTCLTVLQGSGDNDTVIGMASCSGSVKQQWFFINGKIHWGGNRSLCLAKDRVRKLLCLQPCDTISECWSQDQEDRLTLGSEALDVPWQAPRTKVILYPKHSGINQKWWTLSQLKTCLEKCNVNQNICPCHNAQDSAAISKEEDTVDGNQADISPEFLISRSTLTALTVLNGTNVDTASIGLSTFTGDVNQQWFVKSEKWHWMGDLSYCLEPNWTDKSLWLNNVNLSKTSWNLTKDGILETRGLVLDVPWEKPRNQVIVYPKHGGENQKWWSLSDIRSSLKKCPTSKNDFPKGVVKMAERSCEVSASCKCQRIDKGLTSTWFTGNPSFLVSQSTHTCLSVLDGTSPHDAVIGLAPYTSHITQQWFFSKGRIYWGSNNSLCLEADLKYGKIFLSASNDAKTTWTYDQEGSLLTGSYALDVPWEGSRTKVIVYPKHNGENQKWWLQTGNDKTMEPKLYPFSSRDNNLYQEEVARGIVNKLTPLSDSLPYPRHINHYPGTVPPGTPRINLSCTLYVGNVRQTKNLHITLPKDWQATNMYVVAGDYFRVSLPSTMTVKQAEQITVRVGAQCDCLDPGSPNLANSMFKRMPVVSEEFEVRPGVNTLRSQYGGNLIFTYEGEENFHIKAEVHNVVETLHYIHGKTSSSDWERMINLEAPFGVLETEKVILIVPTSEAKRISDVNGLLQRYNDVTEKLEDLSGFTDNDLPPKGKQWLVDDIQISAGSAHAGFPTMFDHQYYDLTSPETPHDWVVWHELGHNYQQSDCWSYAYGSESTVNLFSLFIEEQLKADDRLKRENKYFQTAQLVDKGMTFENADCWQKLVFLMEIKHAFPRHGWDMFRHLNRTTRTLDEEEVTILHASTQQQYDYVYKTLSAYIGRDLLPHYERWSLTVSDQAKEEVRALHLQSIPRNLSVKCN
ncbi:hypothetical protein SK128_002625 [Halocaridina rubra]|uniref:Peptidase M60 domain-containing protein n=1 Tax=Halocaridina rubra TaxID=373956 RepID=A0AAN8XFA8_HALRR